MIKGGDWFDYFSSIWNYLDFVPPILVSITIVNHVIFLVYGRDNMTYAEREQGIAI